MMANVSRGRVIQAYKGLLQLGRSYPKGYGYFRDMLRMAFDKNRDVTDPRQIEQLLAKCDHIAHELRTLYMLRQYRNCNRHVQQAPARRRTSV